MKKDIKSMFEITDFDNTVSNTAVFLVTDGVFEGLQFSLGSIKCEEVEENGEAILSYDYNVLNNDEYLFNLNEQELRKDLDNFVGDVLTYVITEMNETMLTEESDNAD